MVTEYPHYRFIKELAKAGKKIGVDVKEMLEVIPWKKLVKSHFFQTLVAGTIWYKAGGEELINDLWRRVQPYEAIQGGTTQLSEPEIIVPQQQLYYEVYPGDTLTQIAQKNGLDVKILQIANGIKDPNLIKVGQILAIPSLEWQPTPIVINQPEELYYLPWELDSAPELMEGISHFYGAGEPLNRNTASGEIFNPQALTCASWFYPLGSVVRVTNHATKMSVDCRVNDRGPDRLWKYGEDGIRRNVMIDLTHKAFREIEPVSFEAFVKVELLQLPK